jgi:hypothetical protein
MRKLDEAPMTALTVHAGQLIEVRDAFGQRLPRRAIGPVEAGYDFPVVWACREDEWQAAQLEDREPDGVPWPAEDVTIAEGAHA